MCSPRQPFFFHCDTEMSTGWRPLVDFLQVGSHLWVSNSLSEKMSCWLFTLITFYTVDAGFQVWFSSKLNENKNTTPAPHDWYTQWTHCPNTGEGLEGGKKMSLTPVPARASICFGILWLTTHCSKILWVLDLPNVFFFPLPEDILYSNYS